MELYIVMDKQRLTPANDNVQTIYSGMFAACRIFLLVLFTSSKTLVFLDKERLLQGNVKASQLPAEKNR